MIRRQQDQSDPEADPTLIFLNSINRHSRITRDQITNLVQLFNRLLPDVIDSTTAQRVTLERQADTLDRIAATLERIERAVTKPDPEPIGPPTEPEPPTHRAQPSPTIIQRQTSQDRRCAAPPTWPPAALNT